MIIANVTDINGGIMATHVTDSVLFWSVLLTVYDLICFFGQKR